MPVASADVWRILYAVSRYVFPLLAAVLVLSLLVYILSESRNRRERTRNLLGSGTVGELIVLSGSRNLDVNTWFPVPREGVLGAVRSCDLVIPCPGVRARHLDFSWEDGVGLLIRPHTGCEAFVNGIPVSCKTRAADMPLTHGSVLQVGSAILRLHLFAALDNTAAPVQPPVPDMVPPDSASVCFSAPPGTLESVNLVPPIASPGIAPPVTQPETAPSPVIFPVEMPSSELIPSDPVNKLPPVAQPGTALSPVIFPAKIPSSELVPSDPANIPTSFARPGASPSPMDQSPETALSETPPSPRPLRSDHWKEDLGE